MLAAAPLLALAACSEDGGQDSNRVNEINRDRYVSGDGSNYRWEDPADRFEAPRLQGEDLHGNPIDTDDWAGSVLVVNFWGAWCPPCVAEAKYLVEAAAAFEERWGVQYPSINDEAGRIADDFIDFGLSPTNIPATILIDAEHRVFSIWRDRFYDTETITADVTKALET
jgi:thiol-disulfide isomerase/thioredoxin